jgi:hypothetical protein
MNVVLGPETRTHAPTGKRNGNYGTGMHTIEMIAERRTIREIVAESRKLMRRVG